MTTPINSDKNPSLPTAFSTAGRDGQTSVRHRSDADAAGNHGRAAQTAGIEEQHVDIDRADQMLNLASASLAQPASGNIETYDQAKAVLQRFEALVNEKPEAVLQVQGSGLNELHRALLEVQPS